MATAIAVMAMHNVDSKMPIEIAQFRMKSVSNRSQNSVANSFTGRAPARMAELIFLFLYSLIM